MSLLLVGAEASFWCRERSRPSEAFLNDWMQRPSFPESGRRGRGSFMPRLCMPQPWRRPTGRRTRAYGSSMSRLRRGYEQVTGLPFEDTSYGRPIVHDITPPGFYRSRRPSFQSGFVEPHRPSFDPNMHPWSGPRSVGPSWTSSGSPVGISSGPTFEVPSSPTFGRPTPSRGFTSRSRGSMRRSYTPRASRRYEDAPVFSSLSRPSWSSNSYSIPVPSSGTCSNRGG